jgi:hypothetical protein
MSPDSFTGRRTPLLDGLRYFRLCWRRGTIRPTLKGKSK